MNSECHSTRVYPLSYIGWLVMLAICLFDRHVAAPRPKLLVRSCSWRFRLETCSGRYLCFSAFGDIF